MDTGQYAHERITRADVARLAGVSVASVSYALNGVPNKVSAATSQRIQRAAQLLDYRPSAFARALKTGSVKTFGAIVPDFSNPYFASLNDEIEAAASEHGYSVIFTDSHGRAETERICIEKLKDRNVDVIFTSSALSNEELATLDQQHCRLVFLDHPTPAPGVKCVSTDFTKAMEMLVNHFFEHGHTNIALFYGGNNFADERVEGWMRAHQKAGISAGPIISTHFTREGGYRATLDLINSPTRPTGIIAASDLEAMGVLRALHERHIRIPKDMAVASFDGSIDTLYSFPQLTAIQQDTHATARCAVNAALDPEHTPDVKLIKPVLVKRQSCGCVPL